MSEDAPLYKATAQVYLDRLYEPGETISKFTGVPGKKMAPLNEAAEAAVAARISAKAAPIDPSGIRDEVDETGLANALAERDAFAESARVTTDALSEAVEANAALTAQVAELTAQVDELTAAPDKSSGPKKGV